MSIKDQNTPPRETPPEADVFSKKNPEKILQRQRLTEALRANLRRRKAQVQGRQNLPASLQNNTET